MKTLRTSLFIIVLSAVSSIGFAAADMPTGSLKKTAICRDCSAEEQVFADLAYLNQLLDMVRSYQARMDGLDDTTLAYLRTYLERSGVGAGQLDQFLTSPMSAEGAGAEVYALDAPLELVNLLPEEEVVYIPPAAVGIEGLAVAYAQELNNEVNRTASVTIVSNGGGPRSFGLGGVFEHNNELFTVTEITKGMANGIDWLYVTVTSERGDTHVLPWLKNS